MRITPVGSVRWTLGVVGNLPYLAIRASQQFLQSSSLNFQLDHAASKYVAGTPSPSGPNALPSLRLGLLTVDTNETDPLKWTVVSTGQALVVRSMSTQVLVEVPCSELVWHQRLPPFLKIRIEDVPIHYRMRLWTLLDAAGAHILRTAFAIQNTTSNACTSKLESVESASELPVISPSVPTPVMPIQDFAFADYVASPMSLSTTPSAGSSSSSSPASARFSDTLHFGSGPGPPPFSSSFQPLSTDNLSPPFLTDRRSSSQLPTAIPVIRMPQNANRLVGSLTPFPALPMIPYAPAMPFLDSEFSAVAAAARTASSTSLVLSHPKRKIESVSSSSLPSPTTTLSLQSPLSSSPSVTLSQIDQRGSFALRTASAIDLSSTGLEEQETSSPMVREEVKTLGASKRACVNAVDLRAEPVRDAKQEECKDYQLVDFEPVSDAIQHAAIAYRHKSSSVHRGFVRIRAGLNWNVPVVFHRARAGVSHFKLLLPGLEDLDAVSAVATDETTRVVTFESVARADLKYERVIETDDGGQLTFHRAYIGFLDDSSQKKYAVAIRVLRESK